MAPETTQTKAPSYRSRRAHPRSAMEETAVITKPVRFSSDEDDESATDLETPRGVAAATEVTEVDANLDDRIERELQAALQPAAHAGRRAAVAEPLLPLASYCVLGHLASGRTSEIYLARPNRPAGLARDLALKVLRPELAQDLSHVAAFVKQARLLSGLHHENFVRVCDSGADGNSYYLAMDYLHGIDLYAALQRSPSGLPLDIVLSNITSCARALHYARTKQADAETQYLGLTPSHVMACADGAVKITQLGQTVGPAHAHGRCELAYLAPEHVRGEPTDARSEVFTLGVMLYELTTGVHPYWAPSSAPGLRTLRERLLHADLAPPTKHRPLLPSALAALIMTALARDPRRRYRNCLQLAEALGEVAERLSLQLGDAAVRRLVAHLASAAPSAASQQPAPAIDEPSNPAAGDDSNVITLVRLGLIEDPLLEETGPFALGSEVDLPRLRSS